MNRIGKSQKKEEKEKRKIQTWIAIQPSKLPPSISQFILFNSESFITLFGSLRTPVPVSNSLFFSLKSKQTWILLDPDIGSLLGFRFGRGFEYLYLLLTLLFIWAWPISFPFPIFLKSPICWDESMIQILPEDDLRRLQLEKLAWV